MAYIHSDIRTRVLQRIRDTGYATGEVTDCLNDTINDIYNEYRLVFMQTTQNYVATINNSDITNGVGLPTNYVEAIDLILTTNGKEWVIPYREFAILDETNPDLDDTTANPAGSPQYWYKYGSTIKLFPVPNAAYTLTLRYWKSPTALVADADVPEIPAPFVEILISGASYRILQIKDQYDQAGIHQNKYDEILDKLVVKYARPTNTHPHVMGINRGGTQRTNAVRWR